MEKNEITIGVDAREMEIRGTPMFPCASYHSQIGRYPGGFVPWHWHKEVELVCIHRGTLQVEVGGQVLLVPTGDLLFVNANVLHAYRNGPGEDCVYLPICFDHRLLSGFSDSVFERRYVRPVLACREMSALHLRREVPWQQEAIDHARRAHEQTESAQGAYGYELEVLEHLCAFWRLLAVHHQALLREDRGEDAMEGRVRVMLDHLRQHYQEPLSIAELAQAAHISQRECFRCFAQGVGASPTEYLLRYRVGEAARLLVETDLPITEVGLSVGFNHPSYFGKVFRACFGCTPTQYRREARNLPQV